MENKELASNCMAFKMFSLRFNATHRNVTSVLRLYPDRSQQHEVISAPVRGQILASTTSRPDRLNLV